VSDAHPVAFVLSGGASLGAIQVGMLEALYERGIVPDLILGSSVGAVNGAFIASRAPSVATTQALGNVWRRLRRSTIFPLNPATLPAACCRGCWAFSSATRCSSTAA